MLAKLDALKANISIMVNACLAQQIVPPAQMIQLVFNALRHLFSIKMVVLDNAQTDTITVMDNAKNVIRPAKYAQMEQLLTVVHAPMLT